MKRMKSQEAEFFAKVTQEQATEQGRGSSWRFSKHPDLFRRRFLGGVATKKGFALEKFLSGLHEPLAEFTKRLSNTQTSKSWQAARA